MRIDEQLQKAKLILTESSETPKLDAEILLANVLHQPRAYLHAYPEKELSHEQLSQFTQLVLRRKALEPIAYLTHTKEFWSLPLTITKETLIPRPETEILVETALKKLPQKEAHVADLGTGSGAIALAIAKMKPSFQVIATDISQASLLVAEQNAKTLGIDNIQFRLGNWCAALPSDKFDMIISNPPYLAAEEWQAFGSGLKYEPQDALIAGPTGLEAYISILKDIKRYLKKDGYIAFEHSFNQGDKIRGLLIQSGFHLIETIKDLANLERVTVAIYRETD